MSEITELKKAAYEQCAEVVQKRIRDAKNSMDSLQEAANEETKSSSGDQHETGRAMIQLEKEQIEHLLEEALKLREPMARIDPNYKTKKIELGSYVKTDQGDFFMSIGLGKLKSELATYYAISLTSPLGQVLRGHVVGETVEFNGRKYNIQGLG